MYDQTFYLLSFGITYLLLYYICEFRNRFRYMAEQKIYRVT